MAAKKFIDGIYNYCDRWCERCTFTSRCRNYSHHDNLGTEETDSNNEAFWNRISSNFEEAARLLQKAAEEYGFDINHIPEEELAEAKQKEDDLRAQVKEHPLSVASLRYSKLAHQFLMNHKLMPDVAEELIQHVELGLVNEEEGLQKANQMKDCLEVIMWYEFFIHPKMERALHGKLEGDGWETENGFQNDYDGSAKIALIACDRSIDAWVYIWQALPGYEDQILKLLGLLNRMKRLAEQEFPGHKTFVRPGFDEVEN